MDDAVETIEITEDEAIENIRQLVKSREQKRAGIFLEVPAEEVRLWKIEKQLNEALMDFKRRFGKRLRPWMLQVIRKNCR
jgi:hypothetical protein